MTANFARVTPGAGRVAKAAVAEAGTLTERLKNAKGGWKNNALLVTVFAAGALSFVGLGAVGAVVSFGADRVRNSSIASGQKAVMTQELHQALAAQGINPEGINKQDLAHFARHNPMLQNAIARIDREKSSSNRAGVAAGVASAALSFVPGGGLLASGVAQGAMHIGATTAAEAGSRFLFDKKVLHTMDVLEHIDAKTAAGAPATGFDLFLLRMAQNEPLQAQIKKHTGGKMFHQMNEAEQMAVIQSSPDLMDEMKAAEGDAQLLNNGADRSLLLMDSPTKRRMAQEAQPAAGSWAARVGRSGGARMQAGGFAQQIRAQQAAANSNERAV